MLAKQELMNSFKVRIYDLQQKPRLIPIWLKNQFQFLLCWSTPSSSSQQAAVEGWMSFPWPYNLCYLLCSGQIPFKKVLQCALFLKQNIIFGKDLFNPVWEGKIDWLEQGSMILLPKKPKWRFALQLPLTNRRRAGPSPPAAAPPCATPPSWVEEV